MFIFIDATCMNQIRRTKPVMVVTQYNSKTCARFQSNIRISTAGRGSVIAIFQTTMFFFLVRNYRLFLIKLTEFQGVKNPSGRFPYEFQQLGAYTLVGEYDTPKLTCFYYICMTLSQ